MSVNLQKGQKISLVKPGEPGLKRIMVGLGWDEVEQKRGAGKPVHRRSRTPDGQVDIL